MNKLSRKMEYALMALKHMAERSDGRVTSAKEVVDQTGAPFDAMARVMQLMAQARLLKSEQGAHGGYRLNRDLQSVSLKDLLEIVQGPIELVKCACESPEEVDCNLLTSCNVQAPLKEFNLHIKEFYSHLSLSELLKIKNSSPTPLENLGQG